jgi:histidine triad (HIT) family protein
MKKDCIFCQIANGEIPSYKLYEDDDVIAFLDISQVTRGHTLVVSKEHYDNFLATPKDVLHKVMDIAQRIGQAQIQIMGAKGVNILANCYEEAGQTVMHFHVHVIPRYGKGDNFILEMKNPDADKELLPAIAESIKKELQ